MPPSSVAHLASPAAVKVKTDEGNWDAVCNNTPVFFLRDPHKCECAES